jgi:peptide/nickel transport system substrate-binding protein
VKWADGEPFTARDVAFTFKYTTNPDVGSATSATYDVVKSVDVIDDYTVRVNFRNVNPAWALPFVGVNGQIIPRHIFERYNGSNAQEAEANLIAVGTGPYRVTEFREEDILIIGEDVVSTIKIIYQPPSSLQGRKQTILQTRGTSGWWRRPGGGRGSAA